MIRARCLLIPALLICAAAGESLAQNALGDGRALDRNLQVGSGGVLPGRRDPVMDTIRFNNSVMYGTATGGRSFRGNLGYRAPDQFSGRLGSDDLYTFKRDAATSGLAAVGVRGSDALRYQFAATTGGSAPTIMGHSFGELPRSGTVVTSGAPNALRSTSEFLTARASRPSLVGLRQDEWGAEYVARASPLLGVSWQKTRESPLGAPVSNDPNAPPPAAVTPLTGLESATPRVNAAFDTGVAPKKDEKEKPRPPTMVYTRVLEDVRTEVDKGRAQPIDPRVPALPGTTPDPNAKPVTPEPQTLELQLERLRAQMRGEKPPKTMKEVLERRERDARNDPIVPTQPQPDRPSDLVPGAPTTPRLTPEERQAQRFPGDRLSELTPELLSGIRKSGEKRVDTLVETPRLGVQTPSKDTENYTRMMESGQSWLAKGRYFDAEDRFTRALAAAPGDPMARAGRVNAQLAAGLYLSAVANLRLLFTDHPELVGTKYADNLMPNADRCGKIASQLRIELEQSGSALQRDAAFLMAYLGYQRDDAPLAKAGLEEFARRVDPESASDQAMLNLVQAAWGGGK